MQGWQSGMALADCAVNGSDVAVAAIVASANELVQDAICPVTIHGGSATNTTKGSEQ